MEIVAIQKILAPNLLHCVRSLLWCATTLVTLVLRLLEANKQWPKPYLDILDELLHTWGGGPPTVLQLCLYECLYQIHKTRWKKTFKTSNNFLLKNWYSWKMDRIQIHQIVTVNSINLVMKRKSWLCNTWMVQYKKTHLV